MAGTDYYAVLGISRDADADEIKSAFRRLARKYHPDVNRDDPNAEEKFKELGEAYAVLSDPQKRSQYDRFGSVSDQGQGVGFDFSGGINDIFEMFFGATSARRSGPQVIDGRDLKVDISVDLKEVVTGTKRSIPIERLETCTDCNGSGCAAGTEPDTCKDCGGSGVVVEVSQTLLGQIRRTAPCRKCGGQGRIIKTPCKKCRGEKLVETKSTIEIDIPPGVETGTVLHLPYQGDDGINGGRPGDLYIGVRVKEDPRFQRDDRGMLTTVPISFVQAALGANLTLDGITEEIELEVPPGTQPGQEFRIQGKGVPRIGAKERGDLRVRINVAVPKKLTELQKHLLEQFEASQNGSEKKDKKKGKGFLDQFRETIKGEK